MQKLLIVCVYCKCQAGKSPNFTPNILCIFVTPIPLTPTRYGVIIGVAPNFIEHLVSIDTAVLLLAAGRYSIFKEEHHD